MIKWVAELFEFQIQYQPRRAIKSQALADFTTELSPRSTDVEDRSGPYMLMDHPIVNHAK